jgi:hypothetical protein
MLCGMRLGRLANRSRGASQSDDFVPVDYITVPHEVESYYPGPVGVLEVGFHGVYHHRAKLVQRVRFGEDRRGGRPPRSLGP